MTGHLFDGFEVDSNATVTTILDSTLKLRNFHMIDL